MATQTTEYPNKGIAFQNEAKLSERHPDYQGNFIMEDGFKHSLSIWIKQDKNGKPFLTVSVGTILRDNDGIKVSAISPVKTLTADEYAAIMQDKAKAAKAKAKELHS